MIVKVCKVHGDLTRDQVAPKSDRPHLYICKQCRAANRRRWQPKQGVVYKKRSVASVLAYQKANPAMRKKHYTAANKRQSDELRDAYIVKLLKDTGITYFSPGLVELKRATIKLKREINRLKWI